MRKKKKGQEIKQQEKKSRAKYVCPDDLKTLIKWVQLVPCGVGVMDYDREVDIQIKIAFKETGETPTINHLDLIKDLLSKLPEEAQNFIKCYLDFNNPAPIDIETASERTLQNVISCYRHFSYAWSDIIRYISQRENRPRGIYSNYEERLQPIHAFINWNAKPNEEIIGFAGLIGKFDGDRLRRCKICAKVFWAKNKNSFTCSEPCRNALRQRNHREKNKEAINAKRRENYQYRRKGKKTNGTL